MRRIGYLGAFAIGAALVAGCTNTQAGSAAQSPAAHSQARSTPTTSTAAAPSTTAASSTKPAPKTSASKAPAAPLSKYESDPGVRTLRAWAVKVARSLTAGHATDAAVDKLITPSFRKLMVSLDKGEVGHYYPGPQPFTPVAVKAPDASTHVVNMCFLAAGYSQHPRTHTVWNKRRVLPIQATVERINDSWRISHFYSGKFSCQGVKIPEPSW